MKQGYIKVATASPALKVADTIFNTKACIELAKEADMCGVKVLVYPELCLTGYTCSDLFYSEQLLCGAQEGLKSFIYATAMYDCLYILGLPLVCADKLYNCAAVVCGGQLLGIVPKTNIPNYNEFYEARHFSAAPKLNYSYSFEDGIVMFGNKQFFVCRTMPALKIGVEICEDLWVANPPSNSLCAAGATVIANLSASNEIVGKEDYRLSLVKLQSAKTNSAYLYSSSGEGESTTDLAFSGHCIIAENGAVLAQRKPFDFASGALTVTEIDVERLAHDRRKTNTFNTDTGGVEFCEIEFDLEVVDTTLTRFIDPHPFVPANTSQRSSRCETILAIQREGLAGRMRGSYSKKLVVGISGGLDSCLALIVMVRTMDYLNYPRKDIIAVTMPCFGTTNRTKNNATLLCEHLGVELRIIDIFDAVNQHFKDIGHDANVHNVVYENSQARERTQILMDIANAENALVVGTGDLSELALGWATYNGDHMSMYGVNASVPKTLVRHIVRHFADEMKTCGQENLSEVLYDILNTPVSPELLPANTDGEITQKTEDLVGPYELHDFYLYNMVRFGTAPSKLFRLAKHAFSDIYNDETLLKWLEVFIKRFFSQQFKRSCLPDAPKVGSISLSPRGDWRMPSDACAALWIEEVKGLRE